MSTTPSNSQIRGIKISINRSLPHLKHYLRLVFLCGPKQLLTSRISAKCATVMALMCAPSLLFCSLLTLPAMIFQSPYQNAYFQFSKTLESDPTCWIVLVLTGICAILSLAIPATMPEPAETSIY
jgi:hypothetical protein